MKKAVFEVVLQEAREEALQVHEASYCFANAVLYGAPSHDVLDGPACMCLDGVLELLVPRRLLELTTNASLLFPFKSELILFFEIMFKEITLACYEIVTNSVKFPQGRKAGQSSCVESRSKSRGMGGGESVGGFDEDDS